MNKKIIIVGAGASGLFTSIFLAKKNYDVLVIEKNTKAGRKILASGNGKCNITNKNISSKYFNTSSNKDFMNFSLKNMPFTMIQKIFTNMGLEIIAGEGTRMYPMSMQASSVSDILYNTALSNGVKFLFNEEVIAVNSKKNIFDISTTENKYQANFLILASGSAAMKKLGSSDNAYNFAKKFNHKITNTFASLVQLQSNDKSLYALSGVKTKADVSLLINARKINTLYGDILFTKYGVSGNTILDLSRQAAFALKQNKSVEITCDIMSGFSKNDLIELLNKRKNILKDKEINFLLESIINTKLINYIYKKSNINKLFINELNSNDISNIVNNLKNIKIQINDTNGLENAEVVAGGISLDDIDDKSMQSLHKKNLYFCGEILDVDGNCGGYNFHWAWSSAYTLANSFKKINS